MEKVIQVDQLSFGYGKKPIFEKIGLSIFAGDYLAIIGANGSGKSTFLKLLLGELTPIEGRIQLFSKDIKYFKQWPEVGYVPQNGISTEGSFPATAREVVQANLYSKIGLFHLTKKKHKEKVCEALELVGMQDYANELIGNLSGGQQQRVMIARVLVSDPAIMILDEPTTGIDRESSESLYQLLAKLNQDRGLSIIMVTHDISRASKYINRAFRLDEGSLIELDKAIFDKIDVWGKDNDI